MTNHAPSSDRRILVDDRFDGSSVAAVRTKVTCVAAGEGLSGLALMRVAVAAHEVALNAVRHGGGDGRLCLWRTADALHCLVSDDGPGIPHGYRSLRPQSSGLDVWTSRYGLWLTGQMCSRVQITDRAEGGTDVLLEFPFEAGHATTS